MKKPILFPVWVFVTALAANAQDIGPSTLNASGGYDVIGNNTYEWSVGEMTRITTDSMTGFIVTHGVLQPVSSASTGTNDNSYVSDHVQVFPVPAEDVIRIVPGFETGGELAYTLTDAQGRIISETQVTLATGHEPQWLDVLSLAAGSYILQVTYVQDSKEYHGIYRIQKIR